jgi:hypothetical protein
MLKARKLAVVANVSDEGDYIEFFIQSEDGKRLTPQMLIDAIGDYLLIDPEHLFRDCNGMNS